MSEASSAGVWVSPDCRDGNCTKCHGQAMNLELDDVVPCEHACHMDAEIAGAPSGEIPSDDVCPACGKAVFRAAYPKKGSPSTACVDPECVNAHGIPAERYGEGYWERGEGSNYHGYGDDPGWAKIAGVLRQYLPVGGTLVELGCASGYFVRAARALRIKAVGVDVSEYAIAKAPADVRAHVAVAAATDIGTAVPGSLDGVVSWEMLEHLTDEEIHETLQGIWRTLKPGGLMWHKIALATDGVEGYEHIPFHDAQADATHVSLWTPEEWWEVIGGYGFSRSPHAEDMLNDQFGGRDWRNRFFCYRKPQS